MDYIYHFKRKEIMVVFGISDLVSGYIAIGHTRSKCYLRKLRMFDKVVFKINK